MGFIARAQLASAVSNAGGLGIIETSSGQLERGPRRDRKMRELTDKPFGVNIAQLFVRDASIVDFVAENGVSFVTTSAGDPTKYTKALKDAGLTVFHVVPSLRGALKAVDAGVDGLVVEGNEGGGFKAPTGRVDDGAAAADRVARRRADHRGGRGVRRPLDGGRARARRRGRADGHAHGERGGVARARQLEASSSARRTRATRCCSTATRRPRSACCAPGSAKRPRAKARAVIPKLESVHDLYFGGNIEASFAFSGQVAGRITEVLPVAQILRRDDRRVRSGAAAKYRSGTPADLGPLPDEPNRSLRRAAVGNRRCGAVPQSARGR